MAILHSVFKQTLRNVRAIQLQQHTIKICCKMIQLTCQWTCEANYSVSSTKQSLAWHDVGQLWHVSLIVVQHSTPHMIIQWHIHMVYLLLFFLHQNRSLVTCLT